MKFFNASALLLVAITWSSAAFALSDVEEQVVTRMVGTQVVKAAPMTRQGQLIGCSLEFTAIGRDVVYRQNQPFFMDGSINAMATDKGVIALTLKVVLRDIVSILPTLRAKPFVVSTTYLESKSGKNNAAALFSKTTSDTPGGLFSIFKLDESLDVIQEMLVDDEVTVAFARTTTGLDAKVVLDLTVKNTETGGGDVKREHDPLNTKPFLECFGSLIDKNVKK